MCQSQLDNKRKANIFWRNGCTDPTWNDPACPKHCEGLDEHCFNSNGIRTRHRNNGLGFNPDIRCSFFLQRPHRIRRPIFISIFINNPIRTIRLARIIIQQRQ
ncbi:hypothetical protein SNOG_13193 [Parastagonospora nodorum SN15]|uniref:Uncharacterized protein n=1 Tax=Phaeosphaeria nodorum (strain SN15 / ATCC MYA-4574 / FGSC 10173) TaxID=321614 RepID=Q0U4X1_PHANO|nr:hypothetical protein SNOG_13193 [Parastagonospora nodorum SN15]EAT79520.2 hypothetical protein SNOG_13193 [Parastagonospora nodorum SN15]